MKEKIIIINDNLRIGGIQIALKNMLSCIHNQYDVYLLLFSDKDGLKNDLPGDIHIVTIPNRYRMLGETKQMLFKSQFYCFLKCACTLLSKTVGKRNIVKLLGMGIKIQGNYDIAISYSHPSGKKNFSNGTAEFVLDMINAKKKICYVHCDYSSGGFDNDYNKEILSEFDAVVCVSQSVRKTLASCIPDIDNRIFTAHNFLNSYVNKLGMQHPYDYNDDFINLLTVARLSSEKGIGRVIKAIASTGRRDLRYYVIGDGPLRRELENKIEEYQLADNVFLLGENNNPYRYMINADYLMVPSYHEAAPIVFDEAQQLGLRVISTRTVSAEEIVGNRGVICENNDMSILNVLKTLQKTEGRTSCALNNDTRLKEFKYVIRSLATL